MRFFIVTLLLSLACSAAIAQEDRREFITPGTNVEILGDYFPPDVPTVYNAATLSYVSDTTLNITDEPVWIDGLHRLANPGQWLFSISERGLTSGDAIADSAGNSIAPWDVVRYDGVSSFTRYFCGALVSPPIPGNCDVDGVYLEGDKLILSLSAAIPSTDFIDGITVERQDLISYRKTGDACQVGTGTNPVPASDDCCSKWAFDRLEFDASGLVPDGSNVIAVSKDGTRFIMSLDVTTTLPTATGDQDFLTEDLVAWDEASATFSTFETLPDWPAGAVVEGLSFRAPSCPTLQTTIPADPGDGVVDLCGATWRNDGNSQLRLRVEWLPENGALSYNVYIGSLFDLVDANQDDQPDGGYGAGFCVTRNIDKNEPLLEVDPRAGTGLYYLISANFAEGEGSLGPICPAAPPGLTEWSCLDPQDVPVAPDRIMTAGLPDCNP